MRTTVDIPADLLQDALRASHARTKTMAIVLGLKELVHRRQIEALRQWRGQMPLHIDLRKARKRP